MTLEQLRARIAEIQARLTEISAGEMTDEVVAEMQELNTEFDQVASKVEALEKAEANIAKAQASAGRKVPAAPVNVSVGKNNVENDPRRGFKNSGEFYRSVIQAKRTGTVDKKLVQAGLGHNESVGEDGGFLIPEDFRTEIQKKVTGDESLLSLTTQFQTSSNLLELPTDEVAPWDQTAGIQAYWEGEGNAIRESKHKWGTTAIKLHKLTASVRVTNEMLEDGPAIESWVRANAPTAMMHRVNSAIIGGDGVGKPSGILGSGFRVVVAAEGGQTADTINFQNVNKMVSRLMPGSRGIWLANVAVPEQLRFMKFDLASDTPVPVYLPATGVAGSPYDTLYGRQIRPMMGAMKALGDEGDLILVDLSYYYTVVKTNSLRSDISTHVYFNTDETALKFIMRMGGQVPYKAPVTPEFGSYTVSGIVTLAAR